MIRKREWHTERLVIRAFRDEDLPGLYELHSDPEATKYLGGVWTFEGTRQVLSRIIGNYSTRHLEWYAVADRKTGEFLGVCWLGPLSARMCEALGSGPHIELGYRFVRRHWGRGYATEAAAEMLRRGFVELCLDEVVSIVAPDNPASKRVLTKIGMRLQRTFYRDTDSIELHALRRDEYLVGPASPGGADLAR